MKGVGILIDHVLVLILRPSRPAPYAAANVSAAPRTTSSRTPITERSCLRLLSDSSIAPGKSNATSPVTGEHPSLSFLPFPIHDVVVSDCCSGLILCWCFGCRYVVCNPMTNKWWLLLDNLRSCGEAHLGFNSIVSSHFHVFEYRKMREV